MFAQVGGAIRAALFAHHASGTTFKGVGITALSPEDFLGALHRKDPETVGDVLAEQAAALRNPPTTVEELIESLADVGLRNFVAAVRSFEAG